MADYERTTFFDAHGPLEISRKDGVITGAQRALWDDLKERGWGGLATAIGCYMFCIDTGRNLWPWYVGMTVAKSGFRGEVFQKHKLDIYNELVAERRGRAVMFFFPLLTAEDRFSKAGQTMKPLIQWLERYLMMTAFARNPAISNVRDMQYLRNVEVLGVLGTRPGRPYQAVTEVRRALFGAPQRVDQFET